jgi:hypothetical protein
VILQVIKSEKFAKTLLQMENGKVLQTSELLVTGLFEIQCRKYQHV